MHKFDNAHRVLDQMFVIELIYMWGMGKSSVCFLKRFPFSFLNFLVRQLESKIVLPWVLLPVLLFSKVHSFVLVSSVVFLKNGLFVCFS